MIATPAIWERGNPGQVVRTTHIGSPIPRTTLKSLLLESADYRIISFIFFFNVFSRSSCLESTGLNPSHAEVNAKTPVDCWLEKGKATQKKAECIPLSNPLACETVSWFWGAWLMVFEHSRLATRDAWAEALPLSWNVSKHFVHFAFCFSFSNNSFQLHRLP